MVIDAEKCLVPNTTLLTELAREIGWISLNHLTLPEDVEFNIDE